MDIRAFDSDLSAYCESEKMMGIFRVTLRDEIIYQRSFGYADVETRREFDDASMFTYYSLSKPFAAIGFMRLYDRGLVDLEAHPAEYLDEAKGFDKGVTLRQILTHTSGLPDFEQDHDFRDNHMPGTPDRLREHLRLLSEFPQHFAPGTGTFYENTNFIILALICENLSGKTWEKYIQDEVFDPMGMTHCVVDRAGREIKNRVNGYGLQDGRFIKVNRTTNWVLAAGDIVGTVGDVYCLNKAIKNQTVLSQKAWQEVLTPSKLNTFGFGCNIENWHGKKIILHKGGHIGFRTFHLQVPADDLDLIGLSNSDYGDVRNSVSELLHKHFYE